MAFFLATMFQSPHFAADHFRATNLFRSTLNVDPIVAGAWLRRAGW